MKMPSAANISASVLLVCMVLLWPSEQGMAEAQDGQGLKIDLALAQELNRNQTTLQEGILASYKKFVPPAGGAICAVQLALYSIVEINTPRQTIQMQGWWRHYWSDERLSWDADFWGIDSLVFSWDEIWKPDDLIYELIEEEQVETPALTVYPSGSVFYSAPRVSTVRCKMVLDKYPYDRQLCDFKVGSMSFDASLVDIVPRTVGDGWFEEPEGDDKAVATKTAISLENYVPNTEFGLTRVRITSKNFWYSCCPFPYPIIQFDLEIERQTTTFVTGILLPIIFVTVVGFAVLLMPAPLSGSRPGISISVMFTTSAIYLVAARNVPDIGQITLVGKIYVASLVASLLMTFISILSTAINLVVSEENANRGDLLTVFRHYDADRSGALDQEEAQKALTALGLTKSEREHLLVQCNLQNNSEITLDDWLKIGEGSRQLRPTTQYNIIVGWMLRRINGSGKRTKLSLNKVETARTASGSEDAMFKIAGANFGSVTGSNFGIESEEQTQVETLEAGAAGPVNGMPDGNAKVQEWVALLGLPSSVGAKMKEEEIDVPALAGLTFDKLEQLGVKRVGHQSKLIQWAKDFISSKKPSSAGSPHPTAPSAVVYSGTNNPNAEEMQGYTSVAIGEPMSSSNGRAVSSVSNISFASENAKVMRRTKHLGAWIDFYSLLIFPLGFIVYVLIEFSNMDFRRGNPNTLIELVDEKAGELGERICYANYQALDTGTVEEVCAIPSSY